MNPLQLGVASADITPPVGVRLWGYDPRVSTFVEHPLRAEALACSAGAKGWILVSADVGGFSSPLTRLVRSDIAGRTGLPAEAVVLAATHTHSGPHVTDALWSEQSELESSYFRDLRRALADVAVGAWRARAAGELVHARTAAPALASNRRVQRPDGSWTNEWADPEGRHPGYFDPTVELLGVRRQGGRLDALLVNFGCHPVAFGPGNPGISGDYVSYLKDALEGRGRAETVLFTVSGHANVDPRDCVQADPAVVRRMGEGLAAIVEAALPSLAPAGGAGAGAAEEPWEFRTTWDLSGRVAIYFPAAGRGQTVRTSLCALGAGRLALLGLPGETVSEYREMIARRSPFATTLLVSLANDFIGYLPTDAILREGAYEARLSPLCPIEGAILSRADAALGRLAEAVAAGT